MDQRQLAELRRWATSLQESSHNEELRAAGKAILLLTEEIAQLRIRLDALTPDEDVASGALASGEPVEEPEPEQGARAWFRRTLGMGHEEDFEEEEVP